MIILADLSISISTTSPSTISVSSLILTPIDLRKAWVRDSVLDIWRLNISEPAMAVKGISFPNALAIPMAMAVLPVPGWPAIRMQRPAILPARMVLSMIPAAFLAFF